jgi:hypothetical protein
MEMQQTEDDIGWVITGGLGFNFWVVRFDIAGAMATKDNQFDEEDYPAEARQTTNSFSESQKAAPAEACRSAHITFLIFS